MSMLHTAGTRSAGKAFDMAEVQKHNSASDCWVVISGVVYDLTDFIREHPGGMRPILV